MTFRRPHLLIPVVAILLLSLAVAIAAAMPDTTQAQTKSLKFKKPSPIGSNTYCCERYGNPYKNVAKVRAVGVDRKRIRYSISGDPAFSITKKRGRISYDGSATGSGLVWLTITARDRMGEYESASITIGVYVQGNPHLCGYYHDGPCS